MCCVMLNLSGSFSTQIKMESEEWQIQAEGKSKNMMNYSGRFAAADSKAENSQVCFCTMPYGINKPPLACHSLCSIKE